MKLRIAAYGIARDILGSNQIEYEVAGNLDSYSLLKHLQKDYPEFLKLKSLMVAINDEYAQPDQIIGEGDEVVLIPPVSGG